MNYLAVFGSRDYAMRFISVLRQYNINAALIETPCEVSHSCGVSVKFFSCGLAVAEQIIRRFGTNRFKGFYKHNSGKYIKM